MPSIAEVNRNGRGRYRSLFALGLGLVLVGAFLAGLGAAGTVRGSTVRTGLMVGGLAVLLSLWGFAARISLGQRERSMAVAGTMAGVASLLSLWVFSSGEVFPQTMLIVAVGLIYSIGITVLLSAVLAGVTLPDQGVGRAPTSRNVAWTRSAPESRERRQAADGGTEEDDLSRPSKDD